MSDRTFKVGVFEHQRKGLRSNGKPYVISLYAYALWYSPEWKGCCVHEVTGPNGEYAKAAAMDEHRRRCMNDRSAAR